MEHNSVHDKNKGKHIRVSVLLSESTTSLLNLKTPYLEDLHPDETQICTITSSETDYIKADASKSSFYPTTSKDSDANSLVSELAYFSQASSDSSSTSFMDTFSDQAMYGKNSPRGSGKELPYVLKPTRVQTRPLVTVRALAHGSNLKMNSNNIYVSLLNSQTSISSDYICRICHGGESIDKLLTPCRCRGTIALVHLSCLERWLLESSHSHCELCQHHYEVVREPKYGPLWSVIMFLRHPGDHWKELVIDLISFAAYTPTAIIATYLLMVLCESMAKSEIMQARYLSSHLIAFSAIFGIAVIDFTYTSWLMIILQKHFDAWKEWYRNNSSLKVILPKRKSRPHRKKKRRSPEDPSTASDHTECD